MAKEVGGFPYVSTIHRGTGKRVAREDGAAHDCKKTAAQRLSTTYNYAAPSRLRGRKAPKDGQQPCCTPNGRHVRLSRSEEDLSSRRVRLQEGLDRLSAGVPGVHGPTPLVEGELPVA
jgi:hypothetical protein